MAFEDYNLSEKCPRCGGYPDWDCHCGEDREAEASYVLKHRLDKNPDGSRVYGTADIYAACHVLRDGRRPAWDDLPSWVDKKAVEEILYSLYEFNNPAI